MSTQPTTGLVPTYTCPFCRRTLSQDTPVLIGEAKEARVMRLAGQLAGHLSHEHKMEFAQIGATSGQITGWLMTIPFKHNDPDLTMLHNATRLELRRITKRVEITDEMIRANVGVHFGKLDVIDRDKLFDIFTQMRDALDEVPPPVPA